jgi:transcriptional regulator with XRE-family HTH domain
MALFFDADWFDAQLTARGLDRHDVAHALGLDSGQVAEIWKDQRELSVRDVRLLAELIGATPKDVAARAGVSTPVPAERPVDVAAALTELNERLGRVERTLVELKALILDLVGRGR